MEAARELAELLECEGELALEADPSSSWAATGSLVQLRLRQSERQRERDEALLGAVVQVSLEPARARHRLPARCAPARL